jgi:hypothetical protein
VSVLEDGTTSIALGAQDPDGGTLAYTIVNGPARGTLSGTPPSVTYMPAANYSGGDSFTFRATDGLAASNTATVSIAVQAVNDPPVAAGEAYTLAAGGSLTVSAPGVLANDSDVDSAPLTAVLAAAPASGVLTLAANGSFTYTPAPGFSGPASFTYRASDGAAVSGIATVNLQVQPPPPPVVIFTANFDSGQNSFTYIDNAFRGATQSSYASGSRISSGGFSGGALRVYVGGVNNNTITNMSGGWRRTFTLSAPATVRLSFRYNLNQGSDYESDELSQVLASLDGVLIGTPPSDYVAQVAGDGNGGSAITTGWRLFEGSVALPAGTHTLVIGGYNNRKDSTSERTTILIDDVSVVR